MLLCGVNFKSKIYISIKKKEENKCLQENSINRYSCVKKKTDCAACF